jgi:transposase-like protein
VAAQKKYPDELRERAVKVVLEVREREGNGRGEIARVGRQLGVHPEALRGWLKQAGIDGGQRTGILPAIGSGSRSWNVKCASSGGRMRSSRPRVRISRGNSTRGCRASRVR